MPSAVLLPSGKGGVGKSLVATNICYLLADKGKRVAAIDADISSSNLPEFLGLTESMSYERERLKPVEFNGIQVFSMGLLAGDRAVCMDGASYSELLADVVSYSDWGDVDYFVVDMPAGMRTDEFRRLVTAFSDNLLGSVVVTQPSHSLDAEKVVKLHLDNDVPVLGLIENMSYFKSGRFRCKIFGESTVDALAERYGLEVFGKIPLCMDVRRAVEKNHGRLEGELVEPIAKAVDKILSSKPHRPSFLERIKAGFRQFIEKAIVEMVLALNREIDIKSFQDQYGYTGGRVIRLNLMADDMRQVIASADFKITHDGRLVGVENPDVINTQIDIKPRALAWSVLGSRKLADGGVYDLKTAWLQGDARVFGSGDNVRAVYFFENVWNALRQNQGAMAKLAPLFAKLIA